MFEFENNPVHDLLRYLGPMAEFQSEGQQQGLRSVVNLLLVALPDLVRELLYQWVATCEYNWLHNGWLGT